MNVPSNLNIGTISNIDKDEMMKPNNPLKLTIGKISAPVFLPKIYSNPGPKITIIPLETIDNNR